MFEKSLVLRRSIRAAKRLAVPLFFSALCANGLAGDKQVKRTLKHQADLEIVSHPGEPWPAWSGGKLVSYERNRTSGPVIFAIDRDGRRDEMTFTIPDASYIQIINVAASTSGELAVVGNAATAEPLYTFFVARISADRKQQTVTRVTPYAPKAVTFVPDGTIWTIGNLFNETMTRDVGYHVLQRFDASGKMLSSLTIRSASHPSDDSVSYFQAARDRVGWYTTAGEYIEFSLDGQEIGRYVGPDGLLPAKDNRWVDTSMSLSEQGDVIVGRFSKPHAEFLTLDRGKSTWVPLSVAAEHLPKWARVLGSDGRTLVTTTGGGKLKFLTIE